MSIKITFYDLASLDYSSFFLTGFLQNRKDFGYKLVISRKIPSGLHGVSMDNEWAKILFSICLFKVELSNREFYFCIDTRDSCKAGKNEGLGYHMPMLMKVAYYFKVNYRDDAIQSDSNLKAHASKIIPIGPFFPVKLPFLLRFLPRIKQLKNLLILPSLEEIRSLRNVEKDLDIFFVVRFWSGNRHYDDNELRYQIMKEIKNFQSVVSIVGFVADADGELPKGFAEFRCKRYSLSDYLRNLARAKVALYVRGLHECLSFKLGQFLALGMPIMGQTISNNKKLLYSNEQFASQFAFDDPKQIVQEAVKLLSEPERMRILACANARTFDEKFTPQAVTAGMLKLIINDLV